MGREKNFTLQRGNRTKNSHGTNSISPVFNNVHTRGVAKAGGFTT